MKFLAAPRLPFLGVVLAAMAGILAAEWWPLGSANFPMAGGLLALLAAVLFLRPQLLFVYLFVAASFFLMHCLRTNNTPAQRLAARLGERPRVMSATGSVVTEPKVMPNGSSSFVLRAHSVELEEKREPANARIFARWRGGAPRFGDDVTLFGTARPPEGPRNPGEFDWRSYLRRQDIHRALLSRYPEDGRVVREQPSYPVLRAAQAARDWMQSAISRGLEDDPAARGLVEGIALGIRSETPDDIGELFQQTGTFHLFAVSGLNVAIIAQLLLLLGVLLRLPRRGIALAIIPILAFYAAVTGLQTSSIRAAIMTSVVLAGFFVERKVLSVNSLAAAAVLTLAWDTQQLFSVGFQLSFVVVLALLLLSEPIYELIKNWGLSDPLLPSNLRSRPRRWLDTGLTWVWRGLAVSAAAWIGSAPLIYWNFHLVTPVSLIANLVMVPIAFAILALAMLSLLCAWALPWFSLLFNQANWAMANLLLGTVSLTAQIPGGHFYLERPHPRAPEVELTILDRGAGAAAHLRAEGRDWLFDTGAERDYETGLRSYLRSRGVNRLDGLFLTHGDSLHLGAARRVLEGFQPGLVMDNPLPDRSALRRKFREALDARKLAPFQPAAGDVIDLAPGVSARIVHPARDFSGRTVDDKAFVIQVRTPGGLKILFTSDIGLETEDALLARGADLQSDILIKGQHHSDASGSDDFLDAVQPRLIIASSRDFPEHERVKDAWAEGVRARGIKLMRQDETGAVQLRCDGNTWEARAYLTGDIFRSSSR